MKVESTPLAALIADSKDTLVQKWFERILHTYPESTTGFFSREKDPFRNPIGHTLKEALPALFDGLVQSTDMTSMQPVLDSIVRIRAVQDFTAGQAVAFIFFLKQIIRQELKSSISQFPDEFAALDTRIDEMALLAFDLFMKCRQQVYEIKANEAKRMVFQLERLSQVGSAGLTK